ncbi:hypothetical protein [Microseira wollei]|uniref:Ubiquitin-like domain-containing protein n=1 Tax=Microseira wollei NIES-4236 TaxID=2530354 RepID=A0AAV3XHW4_9CYAN|nr:hypothetical protein [Microseira wollei]GET41495.1 hypothetical protein MiSe_63070 [Microseira wollei NIES-4236]
MSQEQYVQVTVWDQSETNKKDVDVPLSMKMRAFKEAAKQSLKVDAALPCRLQLKRTGTDMNDEDTFQSAGIQNKDVFKLMTNNPGG